MKFVVFNEEGFPIRTGLCPDDALEQQAQKKEKVIKWLKEDGNPLDYKWVDGELKWKQDPV